MDNEQQWPDHGDEPSSPERTPETDPDAPEIDEADPYAALHAMRKRERPKLRGPLNRNPDDLLERAGEEEGGGYWDDVEGGDGPPPARPSKPGAIPRPTGRRGAPRAARGTRGPQRKRRRSFSAGEVISKSFSTWAGNLLPFAMITAVVLSPAIMINILFAAIPPAQGDVMAVVIFGVGMLAATIILQQVATAALIFGVFQHLRDQPVSFGDCIQRGLAKLLPVLGVGLAVGLLAIAPFVPCGIAGIMAAATGNDALLAVTVLLGLVGLPFYIYIALSMHSAVPAAVVENTSVVDSIKRSFRLASGERGSIFVAFLVIGLVSGMIGGVAGGATAMADPIVKAVMEQILSLFQVSLGATVSAVIYHDLRIAKEGIETHELASVFD